MSDKKISQLTSATTPLGGTELVPIVQSGTTKQVAVSDLTAGRSVAMALLNVDNVRIDGNSITATNTNGNLDLNANGTGLVTTNKGMYIKGDIEFTNGGTASLGKLWNDVGWTSFRADYTNVYGLKLDAYSAIRVNINNAEIARFGSTGLAFTSGKGIDFSATSDPASGMTSELLADYEEGTWTPTPVNLTVVGSATYTGKYTKIGRSVYWSIQVSPSGGSTTASTLTTTTFTGLPYTVNAIATCQAATGAIGSLLNGYVTGTTIYPPAWAATGADVSITGTYIV